MQSQAPGWQSRLASASLAKYLQHARLQPGMVPSCRSNESSRWAEKAMARQSATQPPTWLGISHDEDAGSAPALDGLVSAVLRKGHKALLGWDHPGRVVHCEAIGLRLLLGLLALPNTFTQDRGTNCSRKSWEVVCLSWLPA